MSQTFLPLPNICRACVLLTVLLTGGVSPAQETPAATDVERLRLFEQKIHPVLIAKCYGCHSQQAADVEGGLRLDSRHGIRTGGDSGPAVVPRNLEESLLFQAITSTDNSMPPDDPLDPNVIDDIRSWILAGAVDSRDDADADAIHDPDFTEARKYWAFQPVKSHPVPVVTDTNWPNTAIDHFILSRLQRRGFQPAPSAEPEVLIRRLYFDLIGLPPTPEETGEFVNDPTEHVYQRIVDRLLDSPQYGERWAQHWLDVVRYAETEGFEYDRTLPDIWRYRDYVVESLNEDIPYDQFLREQLAGDEISPGDPRLRIASGFHRLGAVRRNAGNQKVASSRNEVLMERTDIVGSVILGLTIGCDARCHDHKFDPIPQQDYYRFQSFFAATHEDDVTLREPAEYQRLSALKEKLEEEIAELKEALSKLSGDEEVPIREAIAKLQKQLPPPGPTLCSVKNDFENASPIHLLHRGDPDLPGPAVGMRSPGVLVPDGQPELPTDTPDPRTQLARELTDAQHPLTARVMVNRVWQHHFGTGLVRTPNDFGKNGAAPSHAELLDYMSAKFVANGWRLKPLHREIVTSRVYRQSSRPGNSTQLRSEDPDNRLLAFFPRRRLSGEELRDAMLSIAGILNPQMGGQSVILPVEQELVDQLYKPDQWVVTDRTDQHNRRSIYLFAKRNLRLPFMEVFDQPTSQTSCAGRQQSTHARQALELLNGQLANRLAATFADRITREAGPDSASRAELAYRLATSRPPLPKELVIAERFIEEVGLREFTLAMFNINAFLYVD